MKFDNTGFYVALGLSDGTLQVFELKNEKCVSEIVAHDNEILSLDFSAKGVKKINYKTLKAE